jgi:transposase
LRRLAWFGEGASGVGAQTARKSLDGGRGRFAAGPLADHDLGRGASAGRHHRAPGPRRTDDRRRVSRLRRAVPGAALAPEEIVVLDKLAAHNVAGRRQALAAAGASLIYLPPYSPDFAPGSQHRPPRSVRSGAPIEQLFAKLKPLLLEAAARTRDELWSTIGRLLATIPPDECARYLHHCEYAYLR